MPGYVLPLDFHHFLPLDVDYDKRIDFQTEAYQKHIESDKWDPMLRLLFLPLVANLMEVFMVKFNGFRVLLKQMQADLNGTQPDFPTIYNILHKDFDYNRAFIIGFDLERLNDPLRRDVPREVGEYVQVLKSLIPAVSITLSREAMVLCFGSSSNSAQSILDLKAISQEVHEEFVETVCKFI